MTPIVETYASREDLAASLASVLAGQLRVLVRTQGRASLAVPGGTTPGPMLTVLGEADLPWEAVTVTLTDERWVPPSSERSNHRLLAETLFQGAASRAAFVPLYSNAPEPDAGMASVLRGLSPMLPLDLVVLGMGVDMHTASLFPGADGLAKALAVDAPSAVAITGAGAVEPRITLSAPTLQAGARHVLFTGADKRASFDHALKQTEADVAPILAILDGAIVHYAE